MNNQQRIHQDLLTALAQMGGVSPFAAELVTQYILTKYKMEEYNDLGWSEGRTNV